MSTTTNVQQVKVNLMTQDQYTDAIKNPNEFYVITDRDYLDGITSTDITNALGYTPYSSSNPSGYITGITSSDISTALGYTPADNLGVVHLAGVETMTAAKNIFGVDAGASGQTNLLAVISDNTGTTGQWVGRMTVGARNKTFLMGTYNNLCILGAHSWTDAQAGTGAAWEPIYINSDGSQAVYIGGSGNTASSGYFKVDNATGKTYVNVGSAASPIWAQVATHTLQPILPVTYDATQTITLTNDNVIYKITPSGNISSMTFSLSSSGASATMAYTFELLVDMSSTARTIAWPSNVTWQDNTAPDISAAGLYFFAFRTLDGGSNWLGNLQGKW